MAKNVIRVLVTLPSVLVIFLPLWWDPNLDFSKLRSFDSIASTRGAEELLGNIIYLLIFKLFSMLAIPLLMIQMKSIWRGQFRKWEGTASLSLALVTLSIQAAFNNYWWISTWVNRSGSTAYPILALCQLGAVVLLLKQRLPELEEARVSLMTAWVLSFLAIFELNYRLTTQSGSLRIGFWFALFTCGYFLLEIAIVIGRKLYWLEPIRRWRKQRSLERAEGR